MKMIQGQVQTKAGMFSAMVKHYGKVFIGIVVVWHVILMLAWVGDFVRLANKEDFAYACIYKIQDNPFKADCYSVGKLKNLPKEISEGWL